MDRGISTLVLAQAAPQKFSLNLRLNLIDQLLQYRPSFELSIVPIIAENKHLSFFTQRAFLSLREIQYVLATTVISIVIASLGEKYLGIEDLSVILSPLWFCGIKTRMLAAAFSAILFFLAYNFSLFPAIYISDFCTSGDCHRDCIFGRGFNFEPISVTFERTGDCTQNGEQL